MYPTSLTDSQWELLSCLLNNNRMRKHCLRDVIDAILYLLKSGCPWRLLPLTFPPFRSVHYYFRKWTVDGTWERLSLVLVLRDRVGSGRAASPSVAVIDSQSIKNSERGVKGKSFDGFKKIKGFKRHILTDSQGNVLAAHVGPAGTHDGKAAPEVISKLWLKGLHRLTHVLGDGAYAGAALKTWVKETFGLLLEEAKGVTGKSFAPAPVRWVVERTFSHFNANRRLARDYERDTRSSESYIYLTQIVLSLKRLAK